MDFYKTLKIPTDFKFLQAHFYFQFFNRLWGSVLGSQHNWAEGTDISCILLPLHTHNLAHCKNPTPECHIYYNQQTYTTKSSSPEVHSLHWGSLLVLHILWVVTNAKWYLSIIMVSHRAFSLSKTPLCSYSPSSLPPTFGNH